MRAGCIARRWTELASEAKKYVAAGYKAMKLRYGWGPLDGARGMQKNVELVRTVREVVGDGVDIMTDAYMGWTLDYAKRMLPLLEPFNLRWLEEPVIPDDIGGYAELKAYGRIPIAGESMSLRCLGFSSCWRSGRWIMCSLTRIELGGSRRRGRLRRWRRRTRCR